MKAGVIVFPGSNCDRDAYHALRDVLGYEVDYLWHAERRPLDEYGLIIVPGGFSYGDYLRPGAIARFAPIMDAVRAYAERGGLVLGICNGFQILCEAGLLPGALTRNTGLKFRCRHVYVQIIFRYCAPDGAIDPAWNPNGSVDAIAGVANERFNVLGMMPHPERACELLLGSEDGRRLLQAAG